MGITPRRLDLGSYRPVEGKNGVDKYQNIDNNLLIYPARGKVAYAYSELMEVSGYVYKSQPSFGNVPWGL